MDNNQKLDFILKLERRDKRKKIIVGIIILIVLGAAMVYSQFKSIVSQIV